MTSKNTRNTLTTTISNTTDNSPALRRRYSSNTTRTNTTPSSLHRLRHSHELPSNCNSFSYSSESSKSRSKWYHDCGLTWLKRLLMYIGSGLLLSRVALIVISSGAVVVCLITALYVNKEMKTVALLISEVIFILVILLNFISIYKIFIKKTFVYVKKIYISFIKVTNNYFFFYRI